MIAGQPESIFPPNALDKLGFYEIVGVLTRLCSTEAAKQLAREISPSTNSEAIREQLTAANEAKNLILAGVQPPFFLSENWKKHLQATTIAGNWLDEDEIRSLVHDFNSCVVWRKFLQKQADQIPQLSKKQDSLLTAAEVIKSISRFIDTEGSLLPNATPELFRCQQAIYDLENQVRINLQRILKRCIQQGWTEEKSYTIRNERYVIPILAEHKNHLKGLIHGASGTNQTFFIEPIEIVELNNDLKEANISYRNEKIRILKQLATIIGGFYTELLAGFEYLTWIDFTLAGGKLAVELKGYLPDFKPNNRILKLIDARNPVLAARHTDKIISFSVTLTSEKSFLMISGPNAGGKSVTLKTIGLLQIMLQSGLLPTVSPDACFPLCTSFFIDLGDNQSIQQNLSTYSAHLNNLEFFLRNSTKSSLVLMDELGSGTDPQIGGAIAQAILEGLLQKKCLGVVTTHYNSLKTMGLQNQKILSACMDFDITRLEPTYRLIIGNPGSSFALEIAKRMGIPTSILHRAQELSSNPSIQLETQLEEISEKQSYLNDLISDNQELKSKYELLLEEEKKRIQAIQQSKQTILQEARNQAQELIREVNAKIERTISEIRKHQASREITKKLRQELENLIPEITIQESSEHFDVLEAPVQVGSCVKVKANNAVATVVEVRKNKAIVETENVQLLVPLSDLIVVEPLKKKTFLISNQTLVNRNYSLELDVRGLRVEVALVELEKYLDSVLQSGLNQVKIIHGKGSGALRNAIRKKLAQTDYVKSFSDEQPQYGGNGATIVQFV